MIENDINYKNLEKLVPQLIKADLYKDNKFECCPHCQSTNIKKYGKYKGIQRYMCKDCHRTFSNTTNSLWYYSKKDANLWIKYMELFLQRKTLRECAAELEINLATAFFWRHKILNVLKSAHIDGIDPEKFIEDIFADTIYFQEEKYNSVINFKSDPYYEQNYIVAVAATDCHDSMSITPLSRHRFDACKFKEKVANKIEQKALIITNGRDRFLRGVTENHNNKTHRKWKDKFEFTDEKLKHIRTKMANWFAKFNGTATKYLENYLPYYILYSLDHCFESMKMAYSLVKLFGFIKTSNIKKLELVL